MLAAAAVAVAAPIGVYRNAMGNQAQRTEMRNLSGQICNRGGSEEALRVTLGKRTAECALRTPVIGRDLEIGASARLLSGTPKALRKKAFLAVDVRAGEQGAHYQLAVYPLQRKAQLRKTLTNGHTEYLEISKGVTAIKGINEPNELRLRAFNVTSGPEKGSCRILAFVGQTKVADVVDEAAGELQGRSAAISIGASKAAKGLVGSFDDVVVRVPNPYE
ncbi:MAG TPA: hypothetical protein VH476_03070 [Solirubrobacterales bacterium]